MNRKSESNTLPMEQQPHDGRRLRYDVLAASRMNRDHWAIQRAAQDLHEMIRTFQKDYTEETPRLLWAEAGIPCTAPGGRCLANHTERTLEDMRGFEWGLSLFIGSMDPLGDEPNQVAEDADCEADEPAIVTH